ncbi:Protein CBG25548 [Caenorhabditis briggsae]|uniref:Protein CBG25548 n=1 Tax=Caenorhabditis briggsae TaxID=6238 RepID=B6IIS0_CAEBR|nr:Protein CBG25548 [Caenorhabditis briggsae]CAR99800.1 Protein CBG25548 [Caenorhabditis briggsae]
MKKKKAEYMRLIQL